MVDGSSSQYPLGIDIAARVFADFAEPLYTSADSAGPMHWLLRYVNHCKVLLNPAEEPGGAVRSHFSKAAWRLICRTGRDGFLPILRNRGLTFHDLTSYAETLVKAGWQKAPEPRLLAMLIRQKYEFFDSPAAMPIDPNDMVLIRAASRRSGPAERDFMLVTRWSTHSGTSLAGSEQWQGLLRKAKAWTERQKAKEEAAEATPWYFYCSEVGWRGYKIVPLKNGLDLWEEGRAMSHCVYDIRYSCEIKEPSRFFSVRKFGKRVATLELAYQLPDAGFLGTDRLFGRWTLRDLRRSANRPMGPEVVQHLKVFAWQYNLWSQRVGRRSISNL